jgi:hypothetical protein
MLLASALAALAYVITGRDWLHWLALHLALLGGVSQLVLGAGQFFVCAFLATDPPPRRLIAGQLVAWNAGTLLVAVGVPTASSPLTDTGGALIAVGLVLFAAALRGMQRRSLQRARWAVRWYQACAACLGVGALIGILLARGTPWQAGSMLGAHLALNLVGWLGMAIVGTLHTFFPSLTQTRLRFPVLQGPTFHPVAARRRAAGARRRIQRRVRHRRRLAGAHARRVPAHRQRRGIPTRRPKATGATGAIDVARSGVSGSRPNVRTRHDDQ